MSLAYFIVLDQENVPFDIFVNGKFIAHDADKINKICKKLQLNDLDYYIRIPFDDYADDFEFESESEKWFDADEGLEFVKKLKNYIQGNPKSVKSSEGVISDLNEYIELLKKAKLTNAKFHFQIDM
ncbi:MAG: hypothetical protein HQK76_07760 [Desulfobacterales bacterium]|nr:hypothetical protein [Desulfobacterales bacterium]